MTYEILNRINRAMDIYNFPKQNTTLLYLQSIRVLYEKRRYKYSLNLRYMPTEEELRTKVLNLYYEILSNYTNTRNHQEYNELMDVAIQLNVTLPVIDLQQQQNEYRQYVVVNNNFNNITNTKKNITTDFKQITGDKQNVHHTGINESIKQNVIKLVKLYEEKQVLNELKIIEEIQNTLIKRKSWNFKNFKSLDFIRTNISTFGIDVTLKRLLICLWFHINTVLIEHKEELLDILNEELTEMSGTCSTGHMSRLINVLQGFDDSLNIQTREGVEIYIKRYIYNCLSQEVKKAPESVIDSIMEKPEIYKNYVTEISEVYKKVWMEKFGSEHSIFIDKVVEEFINK